MLGPTDGFGLPQGFEMLSYGVGVTYTRTVEMSGHVPVNPIQAARFFEILHYAEAHLEEQAVPFSASSSSASGAETNCWQFPNSKIQVTFTTNGHQIGIRKGSHQPWLWPWIWHIDFPIELAPIFWRDIDRVLDQAQRGRTPSQ